MADGRILKLREPYPSKIFEDLRLELVAAVDDLADTTVSTEDLYALMDVVLEMTVGALGEQQQLLERVGQLEAAIAALPVPPEPDLPPDPDLPPA